MRGGLHSHKDNWTYVDADPSTFPSAAGLTEGVGSSLYASRDGTEIKAELVYSGVRVCVCECGRARVFVLYVCLCVRARACVCACVRATLVYSGAIPSIIHSSLLPCIFPIQLFLRPACSHRPYRGLVQPHKFSLLTLPPSVSLSLFPSLCLSPLLSPSPLLTQAAREGVERAASTDRTDAAVDRARSVSARVLASAKYRACAA